MSKTHLTCLYCSRDPERGIDTHASRYICSSCVSLNMRPHGLSLRFPHDEQDEMFLSAAPEGGSND